MTNELSEKDRLLKNYILEDFITAAKEFAAHGETLQPIVEATYRASFAMKLIDQEFSTENAIKLSQGLYSAHSAEQFLYRHAPDCGISNFAEKAFVNSGLAFNTLTFEIETLLKIAVDFKRSDYSEPVLRPKEEGPLRAQIMDRIISCHKTLGFT